MEDLPNKGESSSKGSMLSRTSQIPRSASGQISSGQPVPREQPVRPRPSLPRLQIPETPIPMYYSNWYLGPEAILDIFDPFERCGNSPSPSDLVMRFETDPAAFLHQQLSREEFKEWVNSSRSTIFMLDSKATNLPFQDFLTATTPLTIFYETMANGHLPLLHTKDPYLTLRSFCPPHSYGADMLSSLMCQLLRKHECRTDLLCESVNISDFLCKELDAVYKVMVFLLKQIPKTMTVYILVDGSWAFEMPPDDTTGLPAFAKLAELVYHAEIQAIVKLLVCSSLPSPRIEKILADAVGKS